MFGTVAPSRSIVTALGPTPAAWSPTATMRSPRMAREVAMVFVGSRVIMLALVRTTVGVGWVPLMWLLRAVP